MAVTSLSMVRKSRYFEPCFIEVSRSIAKGATRGTSPGGYMVVLRMRNLNY